MMQQECLNFLKWLWVCWKCSGVCHRCLKQTMTISVFRDTSDLCKWMVRGFRGNSSCRWKVMNFRASSVERRVCGAELSNWLTALLCAGNDLHLASLMGECVQFWDVSLPGEVGAISKRVDGTAAAVIYPDWATRLHFFAVFQMKCPWARPWKGTSEGGQPVMVGSWSRTLGSCDHSSSSARSL